MPNSLSSLVTVHRQFLRSVRLDADFGRIDALHGYILQPSAKNLLDTTAKHLQLSQQRAFTWTGPYGGGKSSLALALASLAGGEAPLRKAARTALDLSAGDNLLKIFGTRAPWLVLPVVGKRASIIDEIANVIDQNVKGFRGRKPTSSGRRDVIAELVRAAERKDDVGGVLLIVDELGKFLEHAAQVGEDIGFYQELAEAASRCNGNLIVIGVLHQAFEQYASRLGHASQQEWAKVQGRYVDIPLVAGSDEMVSLIGRALSVDCAHPGSTKISEKVAKVIRKRRPSAASNITTLLDNCWPLHPVTAALLGPASKKRFGQNERSVFSFLASAEPLGFSEVLSGLEASSKSYYWPAQFWDYLSANHEPAILASPDGHRWAACAEATERAEARYSKTHVDLVKTVGLIELLRNGSGLAAEKELLVCSVDPQKTSVEEALNDLETASILIFRKHLGAYGVYAGSDFDIEAAIRAAKQQIGMTPPSYVQGLEGLGPITARRHYWETGAMRWFSRMILNEEGAQQYISEFAAQGSQCGEFLMVLNSRESEQPERVRRARELSKEAPRGLLIGVPSSADRIEDLINELSALDFVRSNSRELDGDSIALRELTARSLATRSALSDELRDAFINAVWYHQGDKRLAHKEGLSHLASDIAESIFGSTPHVQSELVNRNAISSNAAKAQRDLLHRMISHNGEPNLAYTAFSADAGLYYTVLKSLGIYRDFKGIWRFADPGRTERSDTLLPAWDAAKQRLFATQEIVSLHEIYDLWSAPPYGIKAGLLPIFAVTFFLAYRNQLALYVENVFCPDFTDAHIDEWLQDATRIGWKYVKIDSSETKLLEALSSALSERLGRLVSPDALDSARALVALVFQLPAWTRRTESLSDDAKAVRRLLVNASDPHKVLFADLPLILNSSKPKLLSGKIAEITGELVEAFDKRLRLVERQLLQALDCHGGARELNDRGSIVSGVGGEFKLEAFATRLANYMGSIDDIEGLLMLAIGKPSRDWTDRDIDNGELQLVAWARDFRRLEALAEVRGRPAMRHAIGVVFGSKRTVTGSFDIAESDSLAVQNLAKELLTKMSSTKKEVFLAAIAEVGAIMIEGMNAEDTGALS